MSVPRVYILHGDDQHALQQRVAEMQARLDSGGMADLNTTRLDGRTAALADLRNAISARPFLAERRLVVVTHPLKRITTAAQRREFQTLLERVPESTALVLLFPDALADTALNWREHKRKAPARDHWLVAWAKANSERAYLEGRLLPVGAAMTRWIQAYIRGQGGQITPQGADLLASLVGRETRTAANECDKLLAYVRYQRPVDVDDVDLLVTSNASANIFDMVDALGQRQGRTALQLLNRLLEEKDALSLFGMIVRQFRLLLLAREVLESGGREADVASATGMHAFVARKVAAQARRFSMDSLENIYHRLLEIDVAIKSGELEAETALNTLTAALCR